MPHNVVPFVKPRAIAEIAAANPRSLEVRPIHNGQTAPLNGTMIGRHIAAEEAATTPFVRTDADALETTMFPRQAAEPATAAAPAFVPNATLLGMPPMPVRAKAKAGWVEARPATEKPAPQPVIVPTPGPSSKIEVRPDQAPANKNETTEKTVKDARAQKWQTFDKLGLKPKKQVAVGAQKLVVSGYRLLGFSILTLIVVVLVGYIATTAFYFFSKSWIMPVAVSPSDEKVVALKSELAAQLNARDKIAAEIEDTDRSIEAQQEFQLEFAKAIKTDLQGRQAALARVRQLANEAASTRTQIRHANDDFAADHASKTSKEFDAGLIDRSTMLSSKYQLAQINQSNLSLAERQADYEQRAQQLALETRGLDDLLANKGNSGSLSYDVLKIKRDYDVSRLEVQKAVSNRKILKTSLDRQDDIIKGLQQSAYLRVIADKAIVAMVPYDNLKGVTAGDKLYSCKLAMVMCHQVGSVVEVLPGEVTFKHPHRDQQLRGQMIELRLDDADAAAKDVLFLGGAPLLF